MKREIENYYNNDPEAKIRARVTFSLIKRENKDKKILDIGCGYGELLHLLKKEGFDNIYGLDISYKCLCACKKKGIRNVIKVDVDRERLPYQKNSFDIVIVTEVFEHLFNPNFLLQEIKRILKKGGIAIFSFPNELNLVCRIKVLLKGMVHDPTAVGSHIRFFEPKSIRKFLERGGFNIIEMRGKYLGKKLYKFFPLLPFLSNKFPSLFARTIFVKAIKK
ncbi:MAG: class I SAM-dependent methyltransferase [Candidatus Pacearchaeota archaeon]